MKPMDRSTSTASYLVVLICSLKFCSAIVDDGERCNEVTFCERCPRDALGIPICQKCYDFYSLFVLDTDTYPPVCIMCLDLPGCYQCSSTRVCDQCMDPGHNGPDLNGTGSCSPCAKNCDYCGKAGSGKCDQCLPGYMKNEFGTCTGCAKDCESCSFMNCLKCNTGFFVNMNGECSACQKNCDSCTNEQACLQCQDGYGFDKSNNNCKSVKENNGNTGS